MQQLHEDRLRWTLHAARCALFGTVMLLIHLQHRQSYVLKARDTAKPIALETLSVLPLPIAGISPALQGDGSQDIWNATDERLGYVLQTSPQSDHIVGFSGPTNLLLAFDVTDRIQAIHFLSSDDTPEHVRLVEQDPIFLPSFMGISREEINQHRADTVSGATLTSLAVQEAILHRLGMPVGSLKFPEPPSLEQMQILVPEAAKFSIETGHPSSWELTNQQGRPLGKVIRTAPAADNLIGYQGPTLSWLYFDSQGDLKKIRIGKSFDNEPYVSYVRDDEYFKKFFKDKDLSEIARIDLFEDRVEGVSGATMTSLHVAESIILAAQQYLASESRLAESKDRTLELDWQGIVSIVVITFGVVMGLSRLRGNKAFRLVFQWIVILYLGIINAELISLAMLVGWAQHGIPWRLSTSLVLLSAAALLVPIFSRHNVYCTQLCPHGAVQQLVRRRLPWQLKLQSRWAGKLKALPALLLTWCIFVAMTSLGFSLVDIEPFDAWVLGVAGWASIAIAVVGLVAACFVPMAYCRFGCPTGALLTFLRFNAASNRWSRRDWIATALVALALGLWLTQ